MKTLPLLLAFSLPLAVQAQSAVLQWDAVPPDGSFCGNVTNYIVYENIPPSTNFVKKADMGISTNYPLPVAGYGFVYYVRAQSPCGKGGGVAPALITNGIPNPVSNPRIVQVPNGTQFP